MMSATQKRNFRLWRGRNLVARPRKAKKARGRHFRVPFVPLVPFVPIVPFHCMKNNARECLRFSPVLRHRKARKKNQGALMSAPYHSRWRAVAAPTAILSLYLCLVPFISCSMIESVNHNATIGNSGGMKSDGRFSRPRICGIFSSRTCRSFCTVRHTS